MILTFGSINADIVVPVPKLPQPGETVLGGSYELLPGGKGANQALAARREPEPRSSSPAPSAETALPRSPSLRSAARASIRVWCATSSSRPAVP
jgi:ribokinase